MKDGAHRGWLIADELVGCVCLLPWASAVSLAQEVYVSLKARGYGNIDPKPAFIDSFTRRWMRSEHRFDAVA
jgi:hypothetical protein